MLQRVKVGHIALSQNGHFYFWAKKGAPDLFTTLTYIYIPVEWKINNFTCTSTDT